MLEWAIRGGKISTNSSTTGYDREDLEALGLVERDHLSDRAKRLLREIDQEHFTRTPPSANGRTKICPGVGGTSRESAGTATTRREVADGEVGRKS